MNPPVRKPVVPAEATQELRAVDLIDILGTKAPAGAGASRRLVRSRSSIAPVGLDLAVRDAAADEEAEERVSPPRKRFKVLVVGVVSGCALILVAAGVARVVHASDEPAGASHASAPTATAPTTTQAPSPSVPTPASAPAPATASPAPATASPAPLALDGNSTGTVRLDHPAKAGQAWLDGKKLTSQSALVSCGTHQIKVGHGRTHSIGVPCGGEIGVSR